MSETATLTLTDFLLARIAEDEWDARPFVNDLGQTRPWVAAEVGGRVDSGPNPLGGDGEVATATTHMAAVHIARFDPARVLAECEAKRRIAAEHPAPSYIGTPGARLACDRCSDLEGPYGYDDPENWIDWPCPTLRALAAIYADHPDYREEWKP